MGSIFTDDGVELLRLPRHLFLRTNDRPYDFDFVVAGDIPVWCEVWVTNIPDTFLYRPVELHWNEESVGLIHMVDRKLYFQSGYDAQPGTDDGTTDVNDFFTQYASWLAERDLLAAR